MGRKVAPLCRGVVEERHGLHPRQNNVLGNFCAQTVGPHDQHIGGRHASLKRKKKHKHTQHAQEQETWRSRKKIGRQGRPGATNNIL